MAETESIASSLSLSTTPMASSQSNMNEPSTAPRGGLLDLEKELACSICTELLYQPLTLLDCLHTFCGSCLKEWFGWQARSSSSHSRARSAPTYTCPSCRAHVRETRPNATVTTLLDMFMQANPHRQKTETERQEVAKIYTPGDCVMPSPPARERESHGSGQRQPRNSDREDAEDRRIMEQVRDLSLREVGVATGGRSRAEDGAGRLGPGEHHSSRGSSRVREQQRSRDRHTLEHQSSLRSLLSSSELDSHEIEEEIRRQIMEEGLLDGIDLSNLNVHQEDEISERIAQAIRRRQGDRQREEEASRDVGPERRRDSDRDAMERRATDTGSAASMTRPPLSRPHLIESTRGERQQTRSSSHGSQGRSTRPEDRPRASIETSRPSNRSATDLSERPHSRESRGPRQRRVSSHDRRATDPETAHRASSIWRRGAHGELGQVADRGHSSAPRSAPSPPASSVPQSTTPRSTYAGTNGSNSSLTSRTALGRDEARQVSSTAPVQRRNAPSVTCRGCSKQSIAYEVHYSCPKCSDGTGAYTLCLRCYRLGRGCKNWYGFGFAAWNKFQRLAPPEGYPASKDPPHTMTCERYQRPEEGSLDVVSSLGQSHDDGAPILQQGVFCDNCHANANACYWKCEVCNDGEWGFCNACVIRGKHCTHPLLPHAFDSPSTLPQSLQTRQPQSTPTLIPMPVRTTCNRCRLPIPPSHTRFHCPQCNEGDYDVCTPCYTSLVAAGKISARNGHYGWRRCPDHGHRIVVVGFEDRGGRQRRVVDKGLVGGWALIDDEDRASEQVIANDVSSPPGWEWHLDGGQAWKSKTLTGAGPYDGAKAQDDGMRMIALWTRIPDEGDEADEITFPRSAEIAEVVEINADWCWGVYCARGGLFPGAFGRIVG